MNISSLHSIYFIGIGGIGMSALARYFHSRGVKVCGYDKTPSALTSALEQEGIDIQFEENPGHIPDGLELAVYTPAVPAGNALFVHLKKAGVPLMKRAEVLGMIAAGIPTIAVAGTHGKTTITSMLAHIFIGAGMPAEALLGGISVNYHTNYTGSKDPRWLIAEADEYDRSFLHLFPEIAAITATDTDHLDIYGSREQLEASFSIFIKNIRSGGTLLLKHGLDKPEAFSGRLLTYHLDSPEADYHTSQIKVADGRFQASMAGRLNLPDVSLGMPGRHNVENALAAAALASLAGISDTHIIHGLSSFKGVKRRFETCFQNRDVVYIDDYAHHPEEIKAAINTARELYPQKKISVIFQPHLYSRTRDLAAGFAESLSAADEVLLMDIYPAREEPIAGVDAHLILKMMDPEKVRMLLTNKLEEELTSQPKEVLLTLGAGDIDRLSKDIIQIFKNKRSQND
jgi:UDP-N-acetylmuramate--alanine ligase